MVRLISLTLENRNYPLGTDPGRILIWFGRQQSQRKKKKRKRKQKQKQRRVNDRKSEVLFVSFCLIVMVIIMCYVTEILPLFACWSEFFSFAMIRFFFVNFYSNRLLRLLNIHTVVVDVYYSVRFELVLKLKTGWSPFVYLRSYSIETTCQIIPCTFGPFGVLAVISIFWSANSSAAISGDVFSLHFLGLDNKGFVNNLGVLDYLSPQKHFAGLMYA